MAGAEAGAGSQVGRVDGLSFGRENTVAGALSRDSRLEIRDSEGIEWLVVLRLWARPG